VTTRLQENKDLWIGTLPQPPFSSAPGLTLKILKMKRTPLESQLFPSFDELMLKSLKQICH